MIDGGLRKLFKNNLPMMHWQPVETGMISSGVPDANFCYLGVEGWVELKQIKKGRIEWRPEQIGWTRERTKQGGLVKLAVRAEHPDDTDFLVMYDAKDICRDFDPLFAMNTDFQGMWVGHVRSWNWDQILQTLIRRA